jgi:hypothetical protein
MKWTSFVPSSLPPQLNIYGITFLQNKQQSELAFGNSQRKAILLLFLISVTQAMWKLSIYHDLLPNSTWNLYFRIWTILVPLNAVFSM